MDRSVTWCSNTRAGQSRWLSHSERIKLKIKNEIYSHLPALPWKYRLRRVRVRSRFCAHPHPMLQVLTRLTVNARQGRKPLLPSSPPTTAATMGLSRSTRIYILLAIDVCFFFAELITGHIKFTSPLFSTRADMPHSGYAVGSLALVADSFHMLKCASTISPSFLILTPVVVML